MNSGASLKVAGALSVAVDRPVDGTADRHRPAVTAAHQVAIAEAAVETKLVAFNIRDNYQPLKPTGRWKLSRTPHRAEPQMFIETKGWIFNHWVHESWIVFGPAPYEKIFTCGGD